MSHRGSVQIRPKIKGLGLLFAVGIRLLSSGRIVINFRVRSRSSGVLTPGADQASLGKVAQEKNHRALGPRRLEMKELTVQEDAETITPTSRRDGTVRRWRLPRRDPIAMYVVSPPAEGVVVVDIYYEAFSFNQSAPTSFFDSTLTFSSARARAPSRKQHLPLLSCEASFRATPTTRVFHLLSLPEMYINYPFPLTFQSCI
jgi:hypothetical protein